MMTPEFELDPADYHLRLMIDQMERDGRSEAAIDRAVRIASEVQERDNTPRRPTTVGKLTARRIARSLRERTSLDPGCA